MDKVRVGIAGLGTIANVMHLPGLRTMQEMGKVDLVAGCDINEAMARETGAKFGIETIYTSLEPMLEKERFDLLVNLTRIPDHYGVTMAGLRAGRHVYTQKPMTTTVAEATELIEEAKRRHLKLASAPEHPVRPVIAKAREMIANGEIGKVAFAKVQSSHFGPETHNVPRDSTWFYKKGSSPILDMGVHGLSQITAILGPVRSLSSMSGRTTPVRVHTAGAFKGKAIDLEIDDNTLLMLDFGEATFGVLDATYCVAASKAPQTEIYGSKGVLALTRRGLGQTLSKYDVEKDEWADVEVPEPPAVRDLGVFHFVNSLLGETDLVLTGERGRHLVEIMVKAAEAAGKRCTLDLETTF